MTDLFKDLVLHWPLDNIANKQVLDLSGNGLHGHIHNGLKVVEDVEFERAMKFSEKGWISVAKSVLPLIKVYTVSVWCKPSQIKTWQGVVGQPGRYFNIWLSKTGAVHHRFRVEGNYNAGIDDSPDKLMANKWYHLVITNDGSKAVSYVNGQLSTSGQVNGALYESLGKLIVGKSLDDHDGSYFFGNMAALRIYRRALSASDVWRLYKADQVLPFTARYPLAFQLLDRAERPVLAALAGNGETMTLRIDNRSGAKISLNDLNNNTASSGFAHFSLRFRKGTLKAMSSIGVSDTNEQWSVVADLTTSDSDTLYLRGPAGLTIAAGKSHHIQLTKVMADLVGGARSTRVQFYYQQISYRGRPLSGSREMILQIVNEDIPVSSAVLVPLQAGFIDGNTILNDADPQAKGSGSKSTLKIQISNISGEAISFKRPADGNTDGASLVDVEFECQDDESDNEMGWAVARKSEVAAINITSGHLQANQGWEVKPHRQGLSHGWTFYPPPGGMKLSAGKALTLTITNICSSLPSGQAGVHVIVDNVPHEGGRDYETLHLFLEVRKAPLLFYDVPNSLHKRVGIGLTNPGSDLSVAGGVAIGKSYARQMVGTNKLVVEGGIGIGVNDPGTDRLHIDGDTSLKNGKLTIANGNVGIGTINPVQKLTIIGNFDDGKDVDSAMGHSGQVAIKGNAPQIDFIDTESGQKDWAIHVNDSKMYFIREPWSADALVLNGEGNVGIGTSEPTRKLDVKGSLKVSGRAEIHGVTNVYGNMEVSGRTLIRGAAYTGKINIEQGAGLDFIRADGGYRWMVYPQWKDTNDPDLMFYYSGKRDTKWVSGWLEPQGQGWKHHSDQRLKKDITPLSNTLAGVMALVPSAYRLVSSDSNLPKQVGFIAQNVEAQFPELVSEKHGYKALNYSNFSVLAIAAIQEQQALIEGLQEQVKKLSGNVNSVSTNSENTREE